MSSEIPSTGTAASAAADADPLAALEVIDLLEIGPVRVDRAAITAPYRVVTGGEEEVHEMAYRYGEDVFDPASAADRNLAGLATAQLALNYGLFCRRIVFRGLFDTEDRRFLRAMMENTAREIFVKKFLEPNPFLGEAVRSLPAVRRASYSRAEVQFVAEPGGEAPRLDPWTLDRQRYAVLSSGGKDSLLSYGLLRELGYRVDPVFLNESGRHWLTALNAHRHFTANVPGTARVWTNSDRLFAAMVRHLPFVRSDFSRVRSDEYPIRLWTVAVFLFGALPILKKRGIGRLVVGDEYDTSVRARHEGITHYDGLYDQSRYFDNKLSRYFRRKGWGLTQFSILRPMSEMLIEKTLAERYGELLHLQVSCHAAHTEGGRVRPCGRCEKCRRVAGILAAIGIEPEACGFSGRQMEEIRKALVERGVHQERAGAQQLAWMLREKKLISEPRLGTVRARRRPEVLRLRIDARRSPVQDIPVALRRPLYTLLLEHAEGALRRVGRQWIDYDLLGDPHLDIPYPFDRPSEKGQRPPSSAPATGILWGEMTWPQARDRLRKTDTVLLPVGAIEQHGHHLPLDTDAFDAEYMAREVASRCGEPKPLVLPLLPYGVSYHHDDFAGTISVTNECLSRLVYEIGLSAARNGIAKLVIVNGHGGNGPALHFAAQMINRDTHIFTCVDSGETSDTDVEGMTETPNDVHAGEIETSTTLAVRPHLVRMEQAHASVPDFSSRYLDFSSQRSVGWYARTARISETGVMGDPLKASAEKGRKIWDVMIKNLVELVEHLKDLSLDEIYQRRY